jgi:hypothetical protein
MKYRKKPIVVEALKYTGKNDDEIKFFCPTARAPADKKPNLIIPTLEGEMLVSVGDYVIKGVQGEFYPCKGVIFELTYEKVEERSKWKPWIRIFGCDVLADRNSGDVYPAMYPGERFIQCRYCDARVYKQLLLPPFSMDNPPDICPNCGNGGD